MIEYAKRVRKLETSATLAMASRSKEMMRAGIDVISLAAGEPDWDPPFEAKEASMNAIQEGNAHYTENSGLPALKELIVDKLKDENNLMLDKKNIIVTSGAKFALYSALQSLVDEGDEVLVPVPYWVSYVEQIKLAGGVPKLVLTAEDDGFKIDINDLERHISSRVKGIILNNPSNPAGVTYSQDELKIIGDIAVKKNIFIISDEIYEYFNYAGSHISIASLSQEIFNNTITINGFSKAYSMPGWRVGYAAANEEIIKKMDELQSHSTSNPNTIAQHACISCLKGSKKYVEKMVSEFRERRDFIVRALNGIHGVRCLLPDGTFYTFPNIQYYLAKEIGGAIPTNSSDFSGILLEKAHVGVVPGSAFGLEGYIRISYTQPLSRLEEAVKRIRSLLDRIDQ